MLSTSLLKRFISGKINLGCCFNIITPTHSSSLRGIKLEIKKMLTRNYSSAAMFLQTGKHKIGVVQLTCKADKNENFEVAKKLIIEAKEKGALV